MAVVQRSNFSLKHIKRKLETKQTLWGNRILEQGKQESSESGCMATAGTVKPPAQHNTGRHARRVRSLVLSADTDRTGPPFASKAKKEIKKETLKT